jgi:hypothetical protein
MGQKDSPIGQSTAIQSKNKDASSIDFVLEKSIFNNIFEKDIRRAYIYKKAERLGKAIHLITPAFSNSVSLKNKVDEIAVRLIDAALLPASAARRELSRELLTLSSILSIARTGGFLSAMNTDLITREAHMLLQEIAAYEEPRILIEETPTLSSISRETSATRSGFLQSNPRVTSHVKARTQSTHEGGSKGHIKDNEDAHVKDRREAIVSVIENKGTARIKDISQVVRGVSEKTIQRELSALVASGRVLKEGERRWSTYSLA